MAPTRRTMASSLGNCLRPRSDASPRHWRARLGCCCAAGPVRSLGKLIGLSPPGMGLHFRQRSHPRHRQDRRTSRGGPTASSTVTDGSKRPGNCISGSHLRRLALIEGAADCRIRPRTGRAAPGPYPALPLGAPNRSSDPPWALPGSCHQGLGRFNVEYAEGTVAC